MERLELTVTAEVAGCRLDKGLALLAPELSRSQIQTLAEKGSITQNGAAAGKKEHPARGRPDRYHAARPRAHRHTGRKYPAGDRL